MAHYVKIFLAFLVANYLLIFIYDNYYLVNVESDYLISSRNQLREYALDLRQQLVEDKQSRDITISRWASENKIPSQEYLLENIPAGQEIVDFLKRNDYIIDLYGASGPVVYVKLDSEYVVELGPLDPLQLESTSYQPFYIFVHLLVNAVIAVLCYISFRNRATRVEAALASIVDRHGISHEILGKQDALNLIAERLVKLDQYIHEVEDSNLQVIDDQRDLMHAVAHELRSPIARFSFALELIEDEIASPEKQKLLQEMHESVDELESLIREILSYSRLSHGKIELRKEEFDLQEQLKTSIARLQSLYPSQQFEIRCDSTETIVDADRRLLERAFVNLLRNAARFANKKIELFVSFSKDNVEIIIDDDGIGIPPGKKERIFEAFTRLDPSRSRDSGGVGLGLAIVKKVVEKHLGDVSVEDAPIGGARFRVKLPLVPPISKEKQGVVVL